MMGEDGSSAGPSTGMSGVSPWLAKIAAVEAAQDPFSIRFKERDLDYLQGLQAQWEATHGTGTGMGGGSTPIGGTGVGPMPTSPTPTGGGLPAISYGPGGGSATGGVGGGGGGGSRGSSLGGSQGPFAGPGGLPYEFGAPAFGPGSEGGGGGGGGGGSIGGSYSTGGLLGGDMSYWNQERDRKAQEARQAEAARLGGGALAQLVASYNKAYGEAKTANEKRYEQMLGLIGDTGGQQKKDVEELYKGYGSNIQQAYARMGLSNTTIPTQLMQGVKREEASALNRLAFSLQEPTLRIMEGRTDEYPDASIIASLANSLGQNPMSSGQQYAALGRLTLG